MATEFNTGADASLNEAVKSRYEANADTNAFTDGEKNKLAGIAAGAEQNAVNSVNGATGAVSLHADDIDDATTSHKFATAAQLSKLDGIEAGATADQSGAEIVSAIDTELGGSTWQTGGSGGGTVDSIANVAQDRIIGRVSAGSGNSEELTAADVRGFLNVLSATALTSTSSGEGASLIGIEDGGTYFSGGTVEAALQELATSLAGHGDIVSLDQADVVLAGGQDVIIFDAGGDSSAPRPAHPAGKAVIWFNHGASLPVNMGGYDIALGEGFGTIGFATETGVSRDLAASDVGVPIRMTSASANSVNIQTNTAEAIAVGSTCIVRMAGTGQTTINWPAGVTVNGIDGSSLNIDGQYKSVSLHKVDTDEWEAEGAIA